MASTEKKNYIVVALRMPLEMHAKLTKDAKRDDMTLAATIRRVIAKAYGK